jgi:hypothetical protein
MKYLVQNKEGFLNNLANVEKEQFTALCNVETKASYAHFCVGQGSHFKRKKKDFEK